MFSRFPTVWAVSFDVLHFRVFSSSDFFMIVEARFRKGGPEGGPGGQNEAKMSTK